jgi:hypothetical protein
VLNTRFTGRARLAGFTRWTGKTRFTTGVVARTAAAITESFAVFGAERAVGSLIAHGAPGPGTGTALFFASEAGAQFHFAGGCIIHQHGFDRRR